MTVEVRRKRTYVKRSEVEAAEKPVAEEEAVSQSDLEAKRIRDEEAARIQAEEDARQAELQRKKETERKAAEEKERLEEEQRLEQERLAVAQQPEPSAKAKEPAVSAADIQAQEQSEQGIANTTPATTTTRSTPSTITTASSIKYINPGKIISIWNTTQDSNSIGTQIIDQRQQHRRRYNTVSKTTTTGRGPILWVDDTMLLDHTLDSYRANLELLLEQAANTI